MSLIGNDVSPFIGQKGLKTLNTGPYVWGSLSVVSVAGSRKKDDEGGNAANNDGGINYGRRFIACCCHNSNKQH